MIKRGAADFVTKPFQFDELRHALDGAIEQRRLKSENTWLRAHPVSSSLAHGGAGTGTCGESHLTGSPGGAWIGLHRPRWAAGRLYQAFWQG